MENTIKCFSLKIMLGLSLLLYDGEHNCRCKSHCPSVLFNCQQCCFGNGMKMYLLVIVWIGLISI